MDLQRTKVGKLKTILHLCTQTIHMVNHSLTKPAGEDLKYWPRGYELVFFGALYFCFFLNTLECKTTLCKVLSNSSNYSLWTIALMYFLWLHLCTFLTILDSALIYVCVHVCWNTLSKNLSNRDTFIYLKIVLNKHPHQPDKCKIL